VRVSEIKECKYMTKTQGIEICDNDGILCVCLGYNFKKGCGCPYYPKGE